MAWSSFLDWRFPPWKHPIAASCLWIICQDVEISIQPSIIGGSFPGKGLRPQRVCAACRVQQPCCSVPPASVPHACVVLLGLLWGLAGYWQQSMGGRWQLSSCTLRFNPFWFLWLKVAQTGDYTSVTAGEEVTHHTVQIRLNKRSLGCVDMEICLSRPSLGWIRRLKAPFGTAQEQPPWTLQTTQARLLQDAAVSLEIMKMIVILVWLIGFSVFSQACAGVRGGHWAGWGSWNRNVFTKYEDLLSMYSCTQLKYTHCSSARKKHLSETSLSWLVDLLLELHSSKKIASPFYQKLDLQKKHPDWESRGKHWFWTFCWSWRRQEATDLRSVWNFTNKRVLHRRQETLAPPRKPAGGEWRERRSRVLAAPQPDPVRLITPSQPPSSVALLTHFYNCSFLYKSFIFLWKTCFWSSQTPGAPHRSVKECAGVFKLAGMFTDGLLTFERWLQVVQMCQVKVHTSGTPTASRKVPDIITVFEHLVVVVRFVLLGSYFQQLMSFLSLLPKQNNLEIHNKTDEVRFVFI